MAVALATTTQLRPTRGTSATADRGSGVSLTCLQRTGDVHGDSCGQGCPWERAQRHHDGHRPAVRRGHVGHPDCGGQGRRLGSRARQCAGDGRDRRRCDAYRHHERVWQGGIRGRSRASGCLCVQRRSHADESLYSAPAGLSTLASILLARDLLSGEVTVKRMTPAEMVAAGIDINNPDNYWTYSFRLVWRSTTITGIVDRPIRRTFGNSSYTIAVCSGWGGGGGGGGGWGGGSGGGGGGPSYVYVVVAGGRPMAEGDVRGLTDAQEPRR